MFANVVVQQLLGYLTARSFLRGAQLSENFGHPKDSRRQKPVILNCTELEDRFELRKPYSN